jgi:citrate lyase subunit beta/citryl-CoA lyase
VITPRRSALYVPGDKPRALAKAAEVDTDCLIFDWEDAVAPAAKTAARKAVLEALSAMDFGHRERVIRVNDLATPWGGEDVQAAAAAGCDALLFPKVESPQQVRQAAAMVAAQAGGEMPIWLMAETPRAVLDIDAIAGAHSAVAVVVMGTSDLAEAMRVRPGVDREPLLAALSRCVLAARARQLDILDGVHLDLDDAQGLAAVCAQGRALGFDGKTLIHPRTIDMANETFSPSPEEVDWSRKIIVAHAEAMKQGKGVAVYEGKLIENLHVENAQRMVAMAAAIEARQEPLDA